MTITTTLNRVRDHNPCHDGWRKLLDGLGKTRADDEPLTYARIVEINGIDDALWACRAEPQHAREWRLFAVWCARQVEHLMDDPHSVATCNVAERFAHGMATQGELDAAWAAAIAARDAARDAAWAAAIAARDAARAAAGAAARDAAIAARDAAIAARAAAWAAARAAAIAAARDARDAAMAAALTAVWAAARDAQIAKFLEIVGV